MEFIILNNEEARDISDKIKNTDICTQAKKN